MLAKLMISDYGSGTNYICKGDTFTTPTEPMFEAMRKATVGDSVYQEDKTTGDFEAKIAKLAGKEAAMFGLSGTMTNQIGIRISLAAPPYSILCDHRAHVYVNEAAGLAVLSQAMVTPVHAANGLHLTLADVQKAAILYDDIHYAPTKLISLENTLGGTILPIEEIKAISEWARSRGIRMHLDGARLWNASAATGISIAEYCSYFDTVSMCMSKGLGAPVGSVLVGSAADIKKAIHIKKQQGGGIRQAGILTAAADCALETVWPTMKNTHLKTKQLAADLEKMGIHFALPVHTNFIFLDAPKSNLNVDYFLEETKAHGININSERIALHHQITDEAIERLKQSAAKALTRSKAMTEEQWAEYNEKHHASFY